MLIFVKNDGDFVNLIFSDYYKKMTIILHIFTILRLIIDWLQNGYKVDLWKLYKIVNNGSFDINEEKRYNTKHRSEKLRAAFLCCFKKDNDQKPTSALAEGR